LLISLVSFLSRYGGDWPLINSPPAISGR